MIGSKGGRVRLTKSRSRACPGSRLRDFMVKSRATMMSLRSIFRRNSVVRAGGYSFRGSNRGLILCED